MINGKSLRDVEVVVLGGFVMDCLVRVEDFPGWGEAVQAESVKMVPGGKGLNQAIALAHLGARVSVIGAVGDDEFGKQVIAELTRHGVDTTYLAVYPRARTPVTLVFTKRDGHAAFIGWKNEGEVIVNSHVVQAAAPVFSKFEALLATFEVSAQAVRAAISLAKKNDTKVFVNPAPPLQAPERVADIPLSDIDVLIPNEWEARLLALGSDPSAKEEDIERVVRVLGGDLEVPFVCVTRAHEGCIVWSNGHLTPYPTYERQAIDTTGGSDAFCAALALCLCSNFSEDDAVTTAHAAGSLAVTKHGGSEAMPSREELENQVRMMRSRRRRG